jgi:radical SAM protein with 4Fe4S-binding SPASM domain
LGRIAVKINGDIYPCDPALYSGGKQVESLRLGNISDRNFRINFGDKTDKRYKIVELMKKNSYNGLPECKKCTTRCLGVNCFFKFGSQWY